MKYGPIKGDVTAKGYLGDTALNSIQWVMNRTLSSASSLDRSASAPTISEVRIGKRVDSSSLPLLKEAVNGTPALVDTYFVNTGGKGSLQTYLKLELTNTLISSYTLSSGGTDQPQESLTLNYTRISLTDGKNTLNYDLKQSTNGLGMGPK